jgi:hypothetical protein
MRDRLDQQVACDIRMLVDADLYTPEIALLGRMDITRLANNAPAASTLSGAVPRVVWILTSAISAAIA